MKKVFFLFLCFPFFSFSQSTGSTDVSKIDSLLALAAKHEAQGQYPEMLDVSTLALQLSEQDQGKESEKYADCLLVQGSSYLYLGNFKIADSLLLESKEIFAKISGRESPKYANNLYYLSGLYLYSRENQKGIDAGKEAVAIYEKLYGKQHLKYSECVEMLGVLYLFSGDNEAAETMLLESKRIGGELTGKESSEYATTLSHLAMLYNNMGRYEEAEPLLLEMKSIFEKTLGTQHIYYGNSLDNLAQFYMLIGRYDQAELYFRESLEIIKKVLGTTHPSYGIGLSNLSVLFLEMGRYEEAETFNLKALEIAENTRGKKNIDYASTLQNLSTIYLKMGRYEEAEQLTLEAKGIVELTSGREHWKYSQLLGSLALIYCNTERFSEAEKLYLETIDVQAKTIGENHQSYALNCYNLANLYLLEKRYQDAAYQLEKAKSIFQQNIGTEHTKYAAILQSQATIKMETGDFEAANLLLREAIAIQEKILGATDFSLSQTFQQLARLNLLQQQPEQALTYLSQYNHINQLLQIQRATHFSNAELQAYQNLFEPANDFLFSFNQLYPSSLASTLSFDQVLFQKGFLLENAIKREQLVANAPEDIRQKHRQWKGYLRRLAKEYSSPPEERAGIATLLEAKANVLEKELIQSIAGFEETRQAVTWQQVQTHLPPHSAAIEFIHYHYSNSSPTDSIFYGALVLRPEEAAPVFVALFEEGQLQKLLSHPASSQSDFLNQLYGVKNGTENDLQSLIWQALEKELDGIQSIYFAPSGLLHRLSFGAIPINEKEKLADRFNLVQLGSTRQLLTMGTVEKKHREAVLFGGINYESPKILKIPMEEKAKPEYDLGTRSKEWSFASVDTTLRGGAWKTLSWTEVEVESIGSILQDQDIVTTIQRGQLATEDMFRQLGQHQPSPGILHLATHGYFFPDPKEKTGQQTDLDSPAAFRVSGHPMIRSGLILAGANRVWEGQAAVPGQEDGILTAYEISQMNLSNTELVVLSACETGLGDIEGNEGVYGLQRAFKIAGAKYLIMSLWQVPDFQTQELMTTFYIEWLEEEKSIPDAFRAAQAQMRQRYPDPFKWAGFVLVE